MFFRFVDVNLQKEKDYELLHVVAKFSTKIHNLSLENAFSNY